MVIAMFLPLLTYCIEVFCWCAVAYSGLMVIDGLWFLKMLHWTFPQRSWLTPHAVLIKPNLLYLYHHITPLSWYIVSLFLGATNMFFNALPFFEISLYAIFSAYVFDAFTQSFLCTVWLCVPCSCRVVLFVLVICSVGVCLFVVHSNPQHHIPLVVIIFFKKPQECLFNI